MQVPVGGAKEKLLATVAVIGGCAILFVSRSFLNKEPGWNHFLGFVLGLLLAQIVLVPRHRSGNSHGMSTIPSRGTVVVSLSVVLLAMAVEMSLFFVFRASLPGWSDFAKVFVWAFSTFLVCAGALVWMHREPRQAETN